MCNINGKLDNLLYSLVLALAELFQLSRTVVPLIENFPWSLMGKNGQDGKFSSCPLSHGTRIMEGGENSLFVYCALQSSEILHL